MYWNTKHHDYREANHQILLFLFGWVRDPT